MDVLANWGSQAQGFVSGAPQHFSTAAQGVVTDMAPQLAGTAPSGKANAAQNDKTTLHDAVALVAVCIVLLWIMGAIVFKRSGV